MQKTKIDWADMTWNPVTGCLHDCEYCYARVIANRFGGRWIQNIVENVKQDDGNLRELGIPLPYQVKKGAFLCNATYPFAFSPTFHRYRLGEPAKIKKPQNIFVCSMADLFGEWVPAEWINAVFEACGKAPQHRYLFLTKNPKRYCEILQEETADNLWFGTTITNCSETNIFCSNMDNTFVSIEPLQSEIKKIDHYLKWVIIGTETGNRKGKVIPKREWIESIVDECRRANTPIFMKNSLRDIWKEPLIQEYPWGKETT